VAIAFSAIGLEAFVNEIIERLSWPAYPDEPAELVHLRTMAVASELASRSTSLAIRVQVIYAAMTGQTFDRARQPYQDFDLLISLRNAVVHDRPEEIEHNADGGREGPPSSIVRRRLVSRGVVDPTDESQVAHGSWMTLTDPRVAAWALLTAVAMARALAETFRGVGWTDSLLAGFRVLD
jgi:hypothetical protein